MKLFRRRLAYGKGCVVKNMMKESEVAHKILNRRNSVSPIIMIGELQESLGQAGYELAMNNGWVVPNYDSGELSVTESQEKLEQLRKLAASHTESVVAPIPTNNIYRRFGNLIPVSQVVEAFSTPTQGGNVEIGDEVVVAEDGQPVKAVVKSRKPDGSFELSFGDNSKPRVQRTYKSEELKKTLSGPAAAPAAAPGSSTTPPPAVAAVR